MPTGRTRTIVPSLPRKKAQKRKLGFSAVAAVGAVVVVVVVVVAAAAVAAVAVVLQATKKPSLHWNLARSAFVV
jgi:hypothetical protein